MAKLKCPCCGKVVFQIKFGGEAADQLRELLDKDPAAIGDWIVGMMALMHFPEKGSPWEELNGRA